MFCLLNVNSIIKITFSNFSKSGPAISVIVFSPSELYREGYATIPKLAEKLTTELVHHIQVK